jgi:hypothetical protein
MVILPELWNIVASYANEYVLLDFVHQNIDKIDWKWLSRNPNAIHLLEKHLDKINWQMISRNPNAVSLWRNI